MTTVSRENVAELYVAFFNRAPDSGGLDYWVEESGLSLEEISKSFFEQDETREKYPQSLDNTSFVKAIYLNLFNRQPDQGGLDYWVRELDRYDESGGTEGIPRDKMILAVVNGAKNDPEQGIYDATILGNKTEVGLDFAEAGLQYVDFSLDSVDQGRDEVVKLEGRIHEMSQAGSPELFVHLNPDITDDDTIDHEETGSYVPVDGYAYSAVAGKKTIDLQVHGHDYTQPLEKNDFVFEVPGSELALDKDRTVEATLKVVDDGGKVHQAETSESYAVVEGDVTPPEAPAIDGPIAGDDTVNAEEAKDFTLSGTSEPLSTVDVTMSDGAGNEVDAKTYTYGNGVWGIGGIDLSSLEDGIVHLSARATDLAGNHSFLTEKALILDTTVPQLHSVTLANDTGRSDFDRVTSDPTLKIDVSDPVASIEYSFDQIHWSAEAPDFSEDGRYDLYVRAVDPAGNVSNVKNRSFVLDREAPEAPSVERILTDSGLSATDAVTNDATLFFTGKAEGNDTVEFWLDGEAIGTLTTSLSGNWSLDYTGVELSDGDHTLQTRATDIAGNVSPLSDPYRFVIDTQAKIDGIGLLPDDDSGLSNSDGVTNVAEPRIDVHLDASTKAGDRISLRIDGNDAARTPVHVVTEEEAQAALATIGIDRQDLGSDGTKQIVAVLEDLAGNRAESSPLTIRLDREAPQPPQVALDDDTGVSDQDRISAKGSYTVELNETDAVAEYSLDGLLWQKEKPLFSDDGEYTIYVRELDLAGNASEAVRFDFRLDTQAPDSPLLDGPIAGDGIVNLLEAVDLGLSGKAEAQSRVEVVLHDAHGKTLTAEGTADGTGKWQIAGMDLSALDDGKVTVEITATDAAGNRSLASWGEFTLETQRPAAPQVALQQDTGLRDDDNITASGILEVSGVGEGDRIEYSANGSAWSDAAPEYATDGYYDVKVRAVDKVGNPSETAEIRFLLDRTPDPAPKVALRHDTGTEGDLLTNDPSLLVVPTDENGQIQYYWGDTWQATPPPFDKDGLQTVWVREMDAAGNPSAVTEFSFHLDRSAPEAPQVSLARDSGIPGDGITDDGTLIVTPSMEGDGIEYSLDGSHWSLEAPEYTRDGTYTVYVRETDAAGNGSADTSVHFTLDRTAPPAPEIGLLHDTGEPGDRYTNDPTLKVEPTESGGRIEFRNGEEWQSSAPTFDADGTYTVEAREVDLAGNVSPVGEFTFTLDRTPPPAPAVSLHRDSGVAGDGITNDGTLDVIPGEEGDQIEYSLDGTQWSATPEYAGDGEYTVHVRELDRAANASPETTLSFTLDTTAPSLAGAPGIHLTDAGEAAVAPAYDEACRVGLYGGADGTGALLGGEVDLDTPDAQGLYRGEIPVTAQEELTEARIAAEDIAGNRVVAPEPVWLGTDGDDVLGSAAMDQAALLFGFDGDDRLFSGKDGDTIFGGKGNDSFVFDRNSGDVSDRLDTVMDFQSGKDKIVTGIAGSDDPANYVEADGSALADLAALIQDAEENHLGGEVHYVLYYNTMLPENSTQKASGYLVIDWDQTPDGVADQVIELVGLATADDFGSTDIV